LRRHREPAQSITPEGASWIAAPTTVSERKDLDVTLSINHVLGSRLETAFSERLHRLEHHNAVDVVQLSAADLERQRLLATTRGGQQLAIALPRHERLFDGAVLLLDDIHAIVVHSANRRWLRLEPRSIDAAIELGYHVGNLHWRVRFEGEVLFVAIEGRPENYVVRLGELIWSRRVAMSVLDEDASAPLAGSPRPHAGAAPQAWDFSQKSDRTSNC
jgi:urease accessory protein